MTECGRLSDRMPEVARGQLSWTPEEREHFLRCPECQAEWELIWVTGRLGEGLVVASPDRIAATVVQRVRQDARRRRTRATLAGVVGLAAAAAVILTVRPQPEPGSAPAPGVTLQIPLPELENLQAAELDSLLYTMDEPLGGGSTLDEPSLGDLDDQELERVLETWEA
jgi:hypothetical protein